MANSNKIILIFMSILFFYLNYVKATTTCYSCNGINCLRTSLTNKQENCTNPLDVCVTIFKDFAVDRKGCFLSIPEEQRSKCDDPNNLECDICQGDLCNKYGRKDFMCVECDSEKDKNCDTNPTKIEPIRCPAPTGINSYCYVERKNGKVKRGCSTETSHQRKCYNSEGSSCKLCMPSDTFICNAPGKRDLTCPVTSSATSTKKYFLVSGVKNVFSRLRSFLF